MVQQGDVELKGLKALRRAKGWTQTDLALAVGTEQYAVSEWERGLRPPRPSTIRRLAKALDVETEALFQEDPLGLGVPLAEPATEDEDADRGGDEAEEPPSPHERGLRAHAELFRMTAQGLSDQLARAKDSELAGLQVTSLFTQRGVLTTSQKAKSENVRGEHPEAEAKAAKEINDA